MNKAFILSICRVCYKKIRTEHKLWVECRNEVVVISFYRYSGSFRDLILLAKVSNNFAALILLKALFSYEIRNIMSPFCGLNYLLEQGGGEFSTCVISAPQSLLSRVRGRFDIAATIQIPLSNSLQTNIINAPPSLWWRWQKQSLLIKKDRKYLAKNTKKMKFIDRRWNNKYKNKDFIYLVDDVFTSGATIKRLASKLHLGQRSVTAVCLTRSSFEPLKE